MPLTVGILIIGSLLWDERRQAWRNARLDMASIEIVTAPIRYVRRSESRGNIPTLSSMARWPRSPDDRFLGWHSKN